MCLRMSILDSCPQSLVFLQVKYQFICFTEPAPVQTIDVEKEVTGLTVHFTETPGDKNYFLVSISEEGSLVSL